ncbi:unnamed protein product, partial [Nesidiocoris tenuis]
MVSSITLRLRVPRPRPASMVSEKWLGQRREWWGKSNCHKCNHPVEKRKSISSCATLAAKIKLPPGRCRPKFRRKVFLIRTAQPATSDRRIYGTARCATLSRAAGVVAVGRLCGPVIPELSMLSQSEKRSPRLDTPTEGSNRWLRKIPLSNLSGRPAQIMNETEKTKPPKLQEAIKTPAPNTRRASPNQNKNTHLGKNKRCFRHIREKERFRVMDGLWNKFNLLAQVAERVLSIARRTTKILPRRTEETCGNDAAKKEKTE